jgi:hypothetical protein
MANYTSNIPQPGQSRAETQAPIEQNFQSINNFVNVNHVGFTNDTDYGKHNFTVFPVQSVAPTTNSTEMALYCAASTGPFGVDLWLRYPSDGMIVQFTGTSSGASANGFAYLSETVFMKWGHATGINPSSANVIVFPTGGGIPAFTATPLSIYFCPSATYSAYSGSTYITAPTNLQFTLQVGVPSFATSVYWMAIGS